MNITVNGKEQDMNIGCRTFISLEQFFQFLKIDPSQQLSVGLNGERIERLNFARTMIKSGDKIRLSDDAGATP